MLEAGLLCLALTIYHEARGEPVQGQKAVAVVVLNRSRERKLTVCQVIAQKGQFAWVSEKQIMGTNRKPNPNKLPVGDSWEKSKRLAKEVWSSRKILGNITYFHHKKETPYWGKKKEKVMVVGNHVFYREPRNVSRSSKNLA